ncbi:MAG: hypothetical protein AMXMBFR84_05640 [Candidatus Hydrogenedentota bacterium]
MWPAVILSLSAIVGVTNYVAPDDDPMHEITVVQQPHGIYSESSDPALAELPSGEMFCVWSAKTGEGDSAIVASTLKPARRGKEWTPPKIIADKPNSLDSSPVLQVDESGKLWLFYASADSLSHATSTDGEVWSDSAALFDGEKLTPSGKLVVLSDGSWLLPVTVARNASCQMLISKDKGATWTRSAAIESRGLPTVAQRPDGSILSLLWTSKEESKTYQSVSSDGGATWTPAVSVELVASASGHALIALPNGHLLLIQSPVPNGGFDQLTAYISVDNGKTWKVRREIQAGPGEMRDPWVSLSKSGLIQVAHTLPNGGVRQIAFNEAWVWHHNLVKLPYKVANLAPPIRNADDRRSMGAEKNPSLPIAVAPFEEHVRGFIGSPKDAKVVAIAVDADGRIIATAEDKTRFKLNDSGTWDNVGKSETATPGPGDTLQTVYQAGNVIIQDETPDGKARATTAGLYINGQLHPSYGVNGPLATNVTAVAYDSKGVLWVGTPIGLSKLLPGGHWEHVTGKQGLPYTDITSIAIDAHDRLWIGTTIGAIHYRPYEEGRQWFYRQGERYLPSDHVIDVAVSPDGATAYFLTDAGMSRIDEVDRTLLEKAEIMEDLLNARHRRLGLVSGSVLNDAYNPTSHTIGDNDNDGLWTAYHVAAMSMAYAVTGDEKARKSAKESMDAVIMLQNASGVPGLVARSVVPSSEQKDPQWRITPDGKLLWKSDTSSDEIDGHYLALYTYWEHIAQFDAKERPVIIEQVRKLTNYLLDNDYLLIDWDGQGTRWGFWQPKMLNEEPPHYLENGLNALQILSFLKVSYYIAGDLRYKEHYDKLISEHDYLSNIIVAKKTFPDENNHSDNQLGYVAWYPILQLEWDPKVRMALRKGVRRHYQTLMEDDSSFFFFVTATIDPEYVNIAGGIDNLRLIPTDRRGWGQLNSHRTDVVFDPRVDRFGKPQLLRVLPADERLVERWNANPYIADYEGNGRSEDDGCTYLLPYWMGRYHGYFTETE